MTIHDTVPLDNACEWINESVTVVLDTMFGLEAEVVPYPVAKEHCNRQIAGSVGFTGTANGVVYVNVSDEFARLLTMRMLTMAPEEIKDDTIVDEVVAELTNMLSGGVKSRLCDTGARCVLSIPTIVRGQALTTRAVSPAEKRSLGFRCGDHYFIIKLIALPAR